MISGLADGPGRGASPSGQILHEQVVPAAAGVGEGRGVLVNASEGREAIRSEKVLGIRLRSYGGLQASHLNHLVIARLG